MAYLIDLSRRLCFYRAFEKIFAVSQIVSESVVARKSALSKNFGDSVVACWSNLQPATSVERNLVILRLEGDRILKDTEIVLAPS